MLGAAWLAVPFAVCAAMASCGGDEFSGAPPASTDGGSTGGAGGTSDASAGGSAPDAGAGGTPSQGGSAGSISQGGSAGSGGGLPESGVDSSQHITVAGKVVDSYLSPIPNVLVRIGTANGVSDANGSFQLNGVTTPYTIELVGLSEGKRYGYAFAKLTRPDPTLQLPLFPSALPMSSNVNGPAQWPDAGTFQGVSFVTYKNAAAGGRNWTALVSWWANISIDAKWFGPSPTEAAVASLIWTEGADKLPNNYLGWQNTPVTVANGAPTSVAFAPKPIVAPSQTLTATVSVPNSKFIVNSKALFIGTGVGDSQARMINDGTPKSVVSYLTPGVPGATFVLCATITPPMGVAIFNYTTQCKAGLAGNADAVPFTPPAPPTIVSPVSGQVDITLQTEFSWTSFQDAAYVVSLTSDAGSSYFVITKDLTAKLPDLTALGEPLLGGTKFSYTVTAIAPIIDMDAATGPQGFLTALAAYGDQRGPMTDGMAGVSELASITAK